jgi:hypothetical protein
MNIVYYYYKFIIVLWRQWLIHADCCCMYYHFRWKSLKPGDSVWTFDMLKTQNTIKQQWLTAYDTIDGKWHAFGNNYACSFHRIKVFSNTALSNCVRECFYFLNWVVICTYALEPRPTLQNIFNFCLRQRT